MCCVMIAVFFAVILGAAYCVKAACAGQYARLAGQVEEAGRKLSVVSQQGLRIAEENKQLESRTDALYALYSITKEITLALRKDELALFFREKLREYMYFDDCRLVEQKKDLAALSDYRSFPLLADGGIVGYLATKGVLAQDELKIPIVLKQLALGLRRIRLYEKIEELAITDSLTGASTRRSCLERLTEEFQRAQTHSASLSVLMADIDHFKKCNDTYGHLVGDAVLREVVKIMKASIREIDLLCRFGGEEFLLVFPDTSKEGAIFAAQRIRQNVEAGIIKVYDETVRVTLSVGVSTFPDDAKAATELIDKSDWALYRAKKSGRNRVCAFAVFQ